jgi:hypothetical protein
MDMAGAAPMKPPLPFWLTDYLLSQHAETGVSEFTVN